jgi:membrane-associated phospholipid phosphatase
LLAEKEAFMEPLLPWGLEIIRTIQQVQGPLLNTFFFAVSGLGSSLFLLLVLPVLFWCVDYRLGMRVAVVCTLSAFCNASLKVLFAQPRPFDLDPALGIGRAGGYGLPSGHAQESVVLWGSIAHFIARKWFWAVTAAILLLIGLSRVYLGVHFPTDVIAGWVVGIMLLGLYVMTCSGIEDWLSAQKTSIQLLLVLAVPLGLLLMHSGVVVVYQSGMLLGIGAGAMLQARFVPFASRCTKERAVARSVIGIIILIASLSLLRGVYSHQPPTAHLAAGFFHSACNGAWISLGAPWLFRLIKL